MISVIFFSLTEEMDTIAELCCNFLHLLILLASISGVFVCLQKLIFVYLCSVTTY